ncbi:MAG: VOC family protein [Chloroflexi bacterium]|nr:VOC family protein [Chloroflexota bacterium]
MNTVTVQLWFNGECKDALQFYDRAFGAEQVGHVAIAPGGEGVLHSMVRIGDTNLMMSDAWPGLWEHGPSGSSTAGLQIYTADCDSLFDRAKQAGCEVLQPVEDMFWGDRMGKLKDPYGHCWVVATHKYVLTPEEMEDGQQRWLSSLDTPTG